MQPHAAGWFAKIFDGKKSTLCVIVDFDEWAARIHRFWCETKCIKKTVVRYSTIVSTVCIHDVV